MELEKVQGTELGTELGRGQVLDMERILDEG
jgi:hypothetical protein